MTNGTNERKESEAKRRQAVLRTAMPGGDEAYCLSRKGREKFMTPLFALAIFAAACHRRAMIERKSNKGARRERR